MDTEKEIVKLICEIGTGLPEQYGDTDLFEAGILDSLTLMQMISELDERFEIEIDIDDVTEANFNTVAHITALVEKYRDSNK